MVPGVRQVRTEVVNVLSSLLWVPVSPNRVGPLTSVSHCTSTLVSFVEVEAKFPLPQWTTPSSSETVHCDSTLQLVEGVPEPSLKVYGSGDVC